MALRGILFIFIIKMYYRFCTPFIYCCSWNNICTFSLFERLRILVTISCMYIV